MADHTITTKYAASRCQTESDCACGKWAMASYHMTKPTPAAAAEAATMHETQHLFHVRAQEGNK